MERVLSGSGIQGEIDALNRVVQMLSIADESPQLPARRRQAREDSRTDPQPPD